MIRVDHAGERGADVIYNGQWDVLKDTDSGDLIKVDKFFESILGLGSGLDHQAHPMVRVGNFDVTNRLLAYVGAGKSALGYF